MESVLTYGEAVVPPGICDAVGGGADRCLSRVRNGGGRVVANPVAVLRLRAGKLTFKHGDAAARRVDVGRDAHGTHAEGPALPGRAGGRADAQHTRGMHADGDEEVPHRMLHRCGAHGVLDDQRVDVEGPRHGGDGDGGGGVCLWVGVCVLCVVEAPGMSCVYFGPRARG